MQRKTGRAASRAGPGPGERRPGGRCPGRALALLFLPAACLLAPAACGVDTDVCNIECQDVSVPRSLVSVRYERTACETCRLQFFFIREAVCGVGKNPTCRCSYYCHSLWELKL